MDGELRCAARPKDEAKGERPEDAAAPAGGRGGRAVSRAESMTAARGGL